MSLFPEVDEEIKDIKQAQNDKLQELKDKSEPYRPSNGSEGMVFEGEFCSTCNKDNPDEDMFCPYLRRLHEGTSDEIVKYRGKVMCLKHSDFSIKSYMGVEL